MEGYYGGYNNNFFHPPPMNSQPFYGYGNGNMSYGPMNSQPFYGYGPNSQPFYGYGNMSNGLPGNNYGWYQCNSNGLPMAWNYHYYGSGWPMVGH